MDDDGDLDVDFEGEVDDGLRDPEEAGGGAAGDATDVFTPEGLASGPRIHCHRTQGVGVRREAEGPGRRGGGRGDGLTEGRAGS